MKNLHSPTVRGFGDEWSRFDQSQLSSLELEATFAQYFNCFPFSTLPKGSVGFDLGCGSGRWARLVAPRVGTLHCIDASDDALAVAQRNLASHTNCHLHRASVDHMPLADGSMDFGYSLGVLHHVPDTLAGIRDCVSKLKPGAPFLLYLYYAFDNRPSWFRGLWQLSDPVRRTVSQLPMSGRYWTSQAIAAAVYLPLARVAGLLEQVGANVEQWPLAWYRHHSFYTMRTDALDRFGTALEKRFTREQIRQMMERAGLENIVFSDTAPFWCAVGYRSAAAHPRVSDAA